MFKLGLARFGSVGNIISRNQLAFRQTVGKGKKIIFILWIFPLMKRLLFEINLESRHKVKHYLINEKEMNTFGTVLNIVCRWSSNRGQTDWLTDAVVNYLWYRLCQNPICTAAFCTKLQNDQLVIIWKSHGNNGRPKYMWLNWGLSWLPDFAPENEREVFKDENRSKWISNVNTLCK